MLSYIQLIGLVLLFKGNYVGQYINHFTSNISSFIYIYLEKLLLKMNLLLG